ncbi:hypothetical protein ABEB36_002319 [Hypothenemus hampei]|uniref:MD-2-related lipid-recognition domain-containing protein n=1 Tax=Hypothenemus hampei TaxID=57062 RepID=A0ABD1F904_HYPHA
MNYLLIVSLAVYCSATKVNQCADGNIENLDDNVSLGECTTPPCKLKKNTTVPIKIKFVAEDEYKDLILVVNAKVAGLDLPFVGVDGTTACDKIFEEDEDTKNECKFVKGNTYVFKDAIEILQIYPKVKTVVHWSITDNSTGKHAVCFEVPAAIVN